MNGVYFGSSTLLCNLGKDLSSKKLKYALKSSFTVLKWCLRTIKTLDVTQLKSTKQREKLVYANLRGEAKTWITTEADIVFSLTNNTK